MLWKHGSRNTAGEHRKHGGDRSSVTQHGGQDVGMVGGNTGQAGAGRLGQVRLGW